MDDLISILERFGIGCYIGNGYYGNALYANGSKLQCSCIIVLRKILDIFDVLSKEYFVNYDASTTATICYGKSD